MKKIRTTSAAAALTLLLALPLAACSSVSGTAGAASPVATTPMAQATGSTPAMADRTGTFSGRNGKSVAGTVTVSDGKLVLSGFSSDEGPDLHVYLANGTDEAAVGAGRALGVVSFSASDQAFSLSGVDVSMYTDVVIHCDKANAVFGAAALS
ncbi:DM13 domain-containing protein [Microbacterium sp. SORGH_AS_0888]|uniref:DM13 domain-containing protein n=1 Tax=Microbacterium sp. SORGH_AS_0888 TaxID=3041791 RepID=UPI00278089B8|nr:DM13 domain-containing protein [Microbacterium sp. SORGH_AS_0888]MDQ1130035.1 hypothetical protein [Microbacterium sp. SORGH_AS_0888]